MSPEEQKYYETYLDLFIHDGWKQFVSEIEDILDNYRIEDIKDEKQLLFVKGERAALYRVRRFANGIKNTYDQMQERDNA